MADKRRALILAGGGMKVGYQAGALQVLLDEAGLEFDHADGTSGGCLNLAMVQSGLSGTRIANNWRATGPFELTSLQAPWRYLAPWKLPSMLTYDRLNRQLPAWGVDFDAIRASPIEGTYNVYNFTAKRFETHDGPELTPELFNACFALPVWFPPVEIGGQTYIDGVYWKDANLTEAVRRGADEIWAIWTVAETAPYPRNAYGQYFAIIEAIAVGRFYEELAAIEAVNAAVRAGTDTEHREITIHVIRHATPVPLDYLLFFSAGDMGRIVDMGVRDARAYLAAHERPVRAHGAARPADRPAVHRDHARLVDARRGRSRDRRARRRTRGPDARRQARDHRRRHGRVPRRRDPRSARDGLRRLSGAGRAAGDRSRHVQRHARGRPG